MITLRKLASLEPGTRLRKCTRLLQEAIRSMSRNDGIDRNHLAGVCRILADSEDQRLSGDTLARASLLAERLENTFDDMDGIMWALADLSQLMHTDLHIERADWDFMDREAGILDASRRTIMPCTVVLDRVRSPFNVGSIFRSADSFGVQQVMLVSPSASPKHPRSLRTARGCTETVAWEEKSPDETVESLQGRTVFAMELGGTELSRFPFPSEGVMIVGSEELGTSAELLAVADASLGRVSIPLAGSKGSLNVSVAFGIVMQAWYTSITDREDGRGRIHH